MINYIKLRKPITKITSLVFICILSICIASCEDDVDLPETGSIADKTPPSANFSSAQNEENFLKYDFANLSTSSTTYAWDFGDGNTSTEQDGENTYPDEGTYTVTLTASDALGVTSTFSQDIEIIMPVVPVAITPVISEYAFENGTGPGGNTEDCVFIQSDGTPRTNTFKATDCWRIIGGTVHQTSSDGNVDSAGDKTRAAKYPISSTNARVSYQAITVTPNTKYILTCFYAVQNDGDKVRIGILDGWMSNASELATTSFLGQADGDVNGGKNNYQRLTFEFESNGSGEVAIWIDSDNTKDVWMDDITIEPL